MNKKPLIFGAALDVLANDPNPAMRQICAIAANSQEQASFQKAVVANLKNPAAMLRAIRNLKATANNRARLARITRNA